MREQSEPVSVLTRFVNEDQEPSAREVPGQTPDLTEGQSTFMSIWHPESVRSLERWDQNVQADAMQLTHCAGGTKSPEVPLTEENPQLPKTPSRTTMPWSKHGKHLWYFSNLTPDWTPERGLRLWEQPGASPRGSQQWQLPHLWELCSGRPSHCSTREGAARSEHIISQQGWGAGDQQDLQRDHTNKKLNALQLFT